MDECRLQIIFILLENHKTYNRHLDFFPILCKTAYKQPRWPNANQTVFLIFRQLCKILWIISVIFMQNSTPQP